ncbi:MAG: hypothetical protein DCC74_09215 [Proteobacteria bacterium]|nr:MAG: hypothetical protein DCC74_09215 [Pseudomonadota bacterium]
MTEQTLTAFLDGLEQQAHDASAAEENFRRDIAKRLRELEQERAFGFRRFNLMRSVIDAVASGKDEEEALAKGRETVAQELQIGAETAVNLETLQRFEPVLRACWGACVAEPEAADAADAGTGAETAGAAAVAAALKEFEAWFSTARNGSFLSLMDQEIVELPLVEVC